MLSLLFVSLGMTLVREQQFSAETERFVSQDLARIRLLTEINEHASDAGRKLLVLLTAPRETRVLAYAEIGAANRQLDSAMQLLPGLLEGDAITRSMGCWSTRSRATARPSRTLRT